MLAALLESFRFGLDQGGFESSRPTGGADHVKRAHN